MLRHYKQSFSAILAGIVLCLLSLFLYLNENPLVINFLHRLEAIPYDIRLKLSIPFQTDNNPPIFIIDIDEKSLKKEGRWPWSRAKLALLVEKLHEFGVVVMALDFVQSETETTRQVIYSQSHGYTKKSSLNGLPNLKHHWTQTVYLHKPSRVRKLYWDIRSIIN